MRSSLILTATLIEGFAVSSHAATLNSVAVTNGGVSDPTCGDFRTVSDASDGAKLFPRSLSAEINILGARR